MMRILIIACLFLTAIKVFALAPGEVWSYHTRANEKKSTLTILKIEKIQNVTIVNVRLDGLKIKNKTSKTGYSEWIAAAPFEEGALKKSLIKKLSVRKKLPAFAAEYKQWRALKGPPIINVPVKEAVAAMEKAANK